MLGVFTDNHYFAFALDYLAFLADFLNGWLYFHLILPFLSYFARQVIRPLVRS